MADGAAPESIDATPCMTPAEDRPRTGTDMRIVLITPSNAGDGARARRLTRRRPRAAVTR